MLYSDESIRNRAHYEVMGMVASSPISDKKAKNKLSNEILLALHHPAAPRDDLPQSIQHLAVLSGNPRYVNRKVLSFKSLPGSSSTRPGLLRMGLISLSMAQVISLLSKIEQQGVSAIDKRFAAASISIFALGVYKFYHLLPEIIGSIDAPAIAASKQKLLFYKTAVILKNDGEPYKDAFNRHIESISWERYDNQVRYFYIRCLIEDYPDFFHNLIDELIDDIGDMSPGGTFNLGGLPGMPALIPHFLRRLLPNTIVRLLPDILVHDIPSTPEVVINFPPRIINPTPALAKYQLKRDENENLTSYDILQVLHAHTIAVDLKLEKLYEQKFLAFLEQRKVMQCVGQVRNELVEIVKKVSGFLKMSKNVFNVDSAFGKTNQNMETLITLFVLPLLGDFKPKKLAQNQVIAFLGDYIAQPTTQRTEKWVNELIDAHSYKIRASSNTIVMPSLEFLSDLRKTEFEKFNWAYNNILLRTERAFFFRMYFGLKRLGEWLAKAMYFCKFATSAISLLSLARQVYDVKNSTLAPIFEYFTNNAEKLSTHFGFSQAALFKKWFRDETLILATNAISLLASIYSPKFRPFFANLSLQPLTDWFFPHLQPLYISEDAKLSLINNNRKDFLDIAQGEFRPFQKDASSLHTLGELTALMQIPLFVGVVAVKISTEICERYFNYVQPTFVSETHR